MTLNVKVNGTTLEGFESLTLEVASPNGGRYPDAEPTGPVLIELRRSATAEPSLVGCASATNGNGTVTPIELAIEVLDSQGDVSHTFKIDDAYLANWQLIEERSDPRAPGQAYELWRVHAGEITYRAGGEVSTFDWPDTLVPTKEAAGVG